MTRAEEAWYSPRMRLPQQFGRLRPAGELVINMPPPVIVSPSDGATVTPGQVAVTFTADPSAGQFELLVQKEAGGPNVLSPAAARDARPAGAAQTFAIVADIQNEGDYLLSVKSARAGSDAWSVPSAPRTLHVIQAASDPVPENTTCEQKLAQYIVDHPTLAQDGALTAAGREAFLAEYGSDPRCRALVTPGLRRASDAVSDTCAHKLTTFLIQHADLTRPVNGVATLTAAGKNEFLRIYGDSAPCAALMAGYAVAPEPPAIVPPTPTTTPPAPTPSGFARVPWWGWVGMGVGGVLLWNALRTRPAPGQKHHK